MLFTQRSFIWELSRFAATASLICRWGQLGTSQGAEHRVSSRGSSEFASRRLHLNASTTFWFVVAAAVPAAAATGLGLDPSARRLLGNISREEKTGKKNESIEGAQCKQTNAKRLRERWKCLAKASRFLLGSQWRCATAAVSLAHPSHHPVPRHS